MGATSILLTVAAVLVSAAPGSERSSAEREALDVLIEDGAILRDNTLVFDDLTWKGPTEDLVLLSRVPDRIDLHVSLCSLGDDGLR